VLGVSGLKSGERYRPDAAITVVTTAVVDPITAAKVDITLTAPYFYHNFSAYIRAQAICVNELCRRPAHKTLETTAISDKAVSIINLIYK